MGADALGLTQTQSEYDIEQALDLLRPHFPHIHNVARIKVNKREMFQALLRS